MKRSTNFNGMKRYRGLGIKDFVLTCQAVEMSRNEIIEAVKDMQSSNDKQSSNAIVPTRQGTARGRKG